MQLLTNYSRNLKPQAETAATATTSNALTRAASTTGSFEAIGMSSSLQRASSILSSSTSSLHSATSPAAVPGSSHNKSSRALQKLPRAESDTTVMTIGGGVLLRVPEIGKMPPAAGPGPLPGSGTAIRAHDGTSPNDIKQQLRRHRMMMSRVSKEPNKDAIFQILGRTRPTDPDINEVFEGILQWTLDDGPDSELLVPESLANDALAFVSAIPVSL